MDTCARCHRQDELKCCSGCRAAKYCSKECQMSDWTTHKAVCRKDGRLPRDQGHVEPSKETPAQQEGNGNMPTPSRYITSLYMSKIDLSLQEGRWLRYFGEGGVSELDLSRYIGNDDGERLDIFCEALVPVIFIDSFGAWIRLLLGKLVWDSTNFHLTTDWAQLINGHVLAARVYRADGVTLVDSWINLDTYIHCDHEELVYDPDRIKLGNIVWPWTMEDYHIWDPRGEVISFVEPTCNTTRKG
ncbi:hypothetical protein J3R82DRAFT_6393 [Butyriboletus roseoflavus]|nr:hypothetical protein J3R82DRAFT_6393 [Butyriboletus roseoflavus]